MHDERDGERIVIVGAGIAGLVCAIELQRAGHDVVVVEREATIGGRVRSRRIDGYTIDRGFQVLFTAYPTLGRHLSLDALAPRRFLPAARIATGDAAPYFGDATRALALGTPGLLADVAAGRALSLRDAVRVLRLRHLATTQSIDECFGPQWDAMTAAELLRTYGLSTRAIDHFFAPFYGGILLDPSLGASASLLLFTLKMLAEGDTVVPAGGMGAISDALGARLRPGTVRTNTTVASLTRDDDRVTGVVLTSGERIIASHVVLATESPTTARLANAIGVRLALPLGALGCTTVWLATREAVLPGRALWLNVTGHRDATVLHAVTMTDVAPEYASNEARHGRHLIAATAVGAAATLDDDALVTGALADIARMSAPSRHGRPAAWMMAVAIERVPYAQYPQPPGTHARPTPASTTLPGLWLASEAAHSSSLEGAARGGTQAAEQLMRQATVKQR